MSRASSAMRQNVARQNLARQYPDTISPVQRIDIARGLRSIGVVGHHDPLRDGVVRVLVALDAIGAATRSRVHFHSRMDLAWFTLAWEEAKAHHWIGVVGSDGNAKIWALMEAGEVEVKKLGRKGEQSSFGCEVLNQRRQKPATRLTLGSFIE